jgi:hypothetical protein
MQTHVRNVEVKERKLDVLVFALDVEKSYGDFNCS